MVVLVTGGAGYIGTVVVDELLGTGHEVVVVDNLTTGRKQNLVNGVPFYECNCGDKLNMHKVFDEHQIDLVMHFAASAIIAESVLNPAMYFHNNVVETIHLLDLMREYQCENFIFSSTGATYGEPAYTPIDENHPQRPTNPYGLTKLINEQTIKTYHEAYGLKYNIFRYFNATGATENREEIREIETHIIPLLIKSARGEHRFIINGNDFPTPDGTCIRDYIHVSDLAQAHIKGIANLNLHPAETYNLGISSGFSNLQVLQAVQEVTGKKIEYTVGLRRQGDPARLIASAEKAKQHLNWQPKFTDLNDMINSVFRFNQKYKDEKIYRLETNFQDPR